MYNLSLSLFTKNGSITGKQTKDLI